MALLESKAKFLPINPKKGIAIKEPELFRWSNRNFYRTSYSDMKSPVSLKD